MYCRFWSRFWLFMKLAERKQWRLRLEVNEFSWYWTKPGKIGYQQHTCSYINSPSNIHMSRLLSMAHIPQRRFQFELRKMTHYQSPQHLCIFLIWKYSMMSWQVFFRGGDNASVLFYSYRWQTVIFRLRKRFNPNIIKTAYTVRSYLKEIFAHYSDVIVDVTAFQITSLTSVYSTVLQAQIKENIKAPCYWPLCWEFAGDR